VRTRRTPYLLSSSRTRASECLSPRSAIPNFAIHVAQPLILLSLPTAADPNAAEAPAGDFLSAEKPIEATDEPGPETEPDATASADADAEPETSASAPVDDAAPPAEVGAAPIDDGVSGVPGTTTDGDKNDTHATDDGAAAAETPPVTTPLPRCTLHEAAELGDIAALASLLSVEGADVDARAEDSESTPLVLAAANSRHEAAKFLLARGADPNAANARGDYALHWACYRGCLATAKALLEAGAEVNARGDVGNTPLHMACTEHHEAIAMELLGRGGDVFARNDVQITPLGVSTKESLRVTVREVEKNGDAARARIRKTLARQAAASASGTGQRQPWWSAS